MNDRAYWVEPSQLSLHPVAELFPEMTASEFDAFRSHFDEHGQQEPVVVDEARRIVDGRHRWRAAESLGKSVWVQFTSELGIHTEEGVLQYAIAKNLHRRHLNESQRAMVAASLSGPARTGRRKKGANLQLSVEQAAESMQVSPRSVSDARKVAEKGAPALVEAVKKGTVKVSTAAQIVDRGQLTIDSEGAAPEVSADHAYLLKRGWAWISGDDPRFELFGGASRYRLWVESPEDFRVEWLAGTETDWERAPRKRFESAKSAHAWALKHTVLKEEDLSKCLVRELTVLEKGFLDANGYEPQATPFDEAGTCYRFLKVLKKTKTERKREVDVCFCWVDGYTPERTGERFVASWSIPGGGVGAGGGTIGFYLTVEEAVAACEHWIEAGEYLPESVARKGEELPTEGHGTARNEEESSGEVEVLVITSPGAFKVYDTLPARVAGLTEGSPFHSVAEEGFDFGALCRGLEIMNYAGTIEDLVERGRPTQDQMDYLHVMLPQVLSWLADVSDAIAAGIGAASTVAGGLEAHPTDGVEVGALEVAG